MAADSRPDRDILRRTCTNATVAVDRRGSAKATDRRNAERETTG
jgi:hypothetical protein